MPRRRAEPYPNACGRAEAGPAGIGQRASDSKMARSEIDRTSWRLAAQSRGLLLGLDWIACHDQNGATASSQLQAATYFVGMLRLAD